MNRFWNWNQFEEELCISVTQQPSHYALQPDETPAQYAKRVREKFEARGAYYSVFHSRMFRSWVKGLGINPTRTELVRAQAAQKDSNANTPISPPNPAGTGTRRP
jgi:hypothetical protein